MKLPRVPGPPGPPRRALGRCTALLAAAAVPAALVVTTASPQQALAAVSPRPAVSAAATAAAPAARTVLAAPAAAPSPSPSPAPVQVSPPGTGGCGFLDFTCYVTSSITSWFASLVKSAVSPLLALIGQTALSTPQPASIPAVQTLWGTSLAVADACYVLLVLIGAIIVMSHETLQTSYSAKEIAPRIVTGFLAANLSMVALSRAIAPVFSGPQLLWPGRGVKRLRDNSRCRFPSGPAGREICLLPVLT
jgi:hypothetical protein